MRSFGMVAADGAGTGWRRGPHGRGQAVFFPKRQGVSAMLCGGAHAGILQGDGSRSIQPRHTKTDVLQLHFRPPSQTNFPNAKSPECMWQYSPLSAYRFSGFLPRNSATFPATSASCLSRKTSVEIVVSSRLSRYPCRHPPPTRASCL